jgi:putative transposase
MPRRARVLIEGGVYHVYNRVASGETVFADPDEAIRFIDLIRKVKARDGWTVFAYCVMSNHFHIAIRTSAVPLSSGMHHLQCEFSRGFNRRSGRTGGLWQSRYQAKLVDEQRYLTQLVLYIHLNPVRAGAVENPVDHEFAGHQEIVKRAKNPVLDVDDSLLCFGDTARSARRAYMSAIRMGCKAMGEPEKTSADGLRSLMWRDRDLEPKAGQEYVDILGRSTGLERPTMPTERFIEEVCRLLGVEPARLASRARDRSTAEMRRMAITLGVERWGQTGRDIAAFLGKNPDVVSYWVGQGVRRRLDDPSFARRLDVLDRELADSTAGGEESRGNR